MKLKRVLLVAIVLIALAITAAVIIGLTWPRINDVTTGETLEYPDLHPQFFRVPIYQVYDAALAAALELGWEIETEDRGNGKIHAVATTPILRFKDDVTILIKPVGEGVSVVVRSRSRVGKGDLGANARRIRRFQAELAKRL